QRDSRDGFARRIEHLYDERGVERRGDVAGLVCSRDDSDGGWRVRNRRLIVARAQEERSDARRGGASASGHSGGPEEGEGERGGGTTTSYLRSVPRASEGAWSLAVRNPDVLDLRGGTEKLSPFGIGRVEPITIVPGGPRALHVRRGRQLDHLHTVAVTKIP